MKTIKEWFERVADPKLREELLANMQNRTHLAKSLTVAIILGSDLNPDRELELLNMAANNQIELIPDTPKIQKSALDKRITGLIKRIDYLENLVNEIMPIIIDPDYKDKYLGEVDPEPEQKIVFDWELSDKGKTIETVATPDKGKQLEEVCRINLYKHIFKQYDRGTPIFYIGHYE
jgi:hypothetical protein